LHSVKAPGAKFLLPCFSALEHLYLNVNYSI
jgi:hypothetical protein